MNERSPRGTRSLSLFQRQSSRRNPPVSAGSVVAFFQDASSQEARSPSSSDSASKPTQDWKEFFSKSNVDRKTVRQLVLDLHQAGKYEDVIALIEQAIVHGQVQPWMYEVLALNMEAVGRPRAQVERVLLSSRDFIADDSDSILYLAAYLTKFERYEQALRLYRQVTALEPLRVEPYVMGLGLAERLEDPGAAMWTIPGVLTRAWGKDRNELHERAERLSSRIAADLRESGRTLQAAALEQITAAARQRDLSVSLDWNGNGDIDLEIIDPTGAVCSASQPATPGGVLHIRSGQGPRQQDCVEEVVAPLALSGEYRVVVKHISGDIVGKRARLTIVRHAGSPRETQQTQTIPLRKDNQLVRILLKGGRLAEPLAVPVLPATEKRVSTDRRGAFNRLPAGRAPRDDSPGVVSQLVGFQPVVAFVPSGVQLTALAVISGDRRYVRISSSPLFTSITDVFTFSFTGATGPAMGTGNF
jgi:hypothetical protein